MKSVNFAEATNKIAEHQEEFNTVISQYQPNDGSVNMCFELSDEEVKQIVKEKKIWYKQVTSGRAMNPIKISPFKDEIILSPLENITLHTEEGRLLLQALVLLTDEKHLDKPPQDVLNQLKEMSNKK